MLLVIAATLFCVATCFATAAIANYWIDDWQLPKIKKEKVDNRVYNRMPIW